MISYRHNYSVQYINMFDAISFSLAASKIIRQLIDRFKAI